MAADSQESPEYTHGCTLTRREALRRGATTAGAIATIGAGTTQVAPQFSPLGRARAAPPLALYVGAVAVGAGAKLATQYLMGDDADRDSLQHFDTLDRLAYWADLYQEAAKRDATRTSLQTTTQDFAVFSEGSLYAEGALGALHAAEDGKSEEVAIDEGVTAALEQLDTTVTNIIHEMHLNADSFAHIVNDVNVIDNLDFEDVLDAEGSNDAGSSHSWWYGASDVEVLGTETVEYVLPSGATIEKEAHEIYYDWSEGDFSDPETGLWIAHPDFTDEVPSTHQPHYTNPAEIWVDEWPEDEYDALDDEDQAAIDPPEDLLEEHPRLWDPLKWHETFNELYDLADSIEGEIETWLGEIYDDLVDGDLEADDVLTPGMLAAMASDNETFPYAGASFAALGVPTSVQTLKLRFPEFADEHGEDSEAWGNLYADPMPSSGFQVGSTYDPDNLNSTLYWAFHTTDDENNQTSEIVRLDHEFEVLKARTVERDPETGEITVVETDEVDFTERTTTEAPTDYDDLRDMLDEVNDLEREIEDQQREIVIELEGDSGDSGGLPDFGGGDWLPSEDAGLLAGYAAGAVLIVLLIIGMIASVVSRLHPASRMR